MKIQQMKPRPGLLAGLLAASWLAGWLAPWGWFGLPGLAGLLCS